MSKDTSINFTNELQVSTRKQVLLRFFSMKCGSPVEILFCIGNFFGDKNDEWKSYISGEAKVPVPTCVLGPCRSEHAAYFCDPDGGDLAPNITFLGRKGLYVTTSGLSVAYLSGLDGVGVGKAGDETHFCGEDLHSLRAPFIADSNFKGVDVLLSSVWPYGVEKYGTPVDGMAFNSKDCGSAALNQLVLSLKPRYHFAALEGAFYERQPYRNHQVLVENARHVTRFLGLSNVGNTSKKRYLYAFNIVPLKHMNTAELVKQPTDVTECPFRVDDSIIQSSKAQGEKSAQFFYDQDVLDGKQQRGGKRHHKGRDGEPQEKRKPKQPTGPCWFCLGSPEVEKHLVVSIGEHTYMALAKGGMTPDHVMILPIGHHQSITSAPAEVLEEVEKYKRVLSKCFKADGKAPVFFERNYKTSHLQIQVVPVPRSVVRELKETFEGIAIQQQFELAEIPKHSDIRQIVPAGAPYFLAELPSGEKLLHRIKSAFPLQFGREVLAHDTILDLPFRVDWKNCKITRDEEKEQATDFKKLFAPYEFNAV